MGLFGFGGKKEEVFPKVSDIFSADDLQKIKDVIGPKHANGEYKKYDDMAGVLLDVANNPDKDFGKTWGAFGGIIFSAGAFTKVEPELAPMLKGAVDKFHAFQKANK